MVELEGIVERIVYRNDENGYTVAKVSQDKDTVSIVGYLPFLEEGQKIKVEGEWVVHQTFGQQVKVNVCEEVVPENSEAIVRYLSSGLIEGIGPVMARRIVAMFGEETLDIMESSPERLTEVEGIGEKKISVIGESFKKQKEQRKVMVFLQGNGISMAYSLKIFKRYGQNTITLIKENPYRLCDDISGIGFKTADKIARSIGIELDSLDRIKSGIKYILSGCTSNGHTYVPRDELTGYAKEMLGIDEELINEAITSLAVLKQIVLEIIDNRTAVYLTNFYYSELGTARKLIELSSYKENKDFEFIEDEIAAYELENNIKFADEQKNAVICGVKNGTCIITGGPGTGKTTIIKCIIKILEKRGLSVVLAAPTGRAAKRITEATGYEAKTIHRLLEMQYMEGEQYSAFAKDESDPIEADAVIIDEASMIDIILMNSLLKAISINTKLIIVGDVDQLPSVGPGNVLRDIIESKCISVVRLNIIFRQANESLIAVNAHRINNGESPILNDKDKDFFFIQKSKPAEIIDEILKLVDVRLPSFKNGFDPMKDIQVLTPMRKGECGIYNLNTKLQEILNPPSLRKGEKKFKDYLLRDGDKVMQIKNNYNLDWFKINDDKNGDMQGTGVFNGDIGFIESIDNEDQKVSVIFEDDRKVIYDFTNLDELELAYAITIHKSQGSEFPVIIFPASYGPPMLMTRNLIYTGVTRAKKLVVMVGMKHALQNMIDNNTITERYSGLKNRIISVCTGNR